MGDERYGRPEGLEERLARRERESREPRAPREAPPEALADLIEMSARRIMTAILIAGGLISIAIYMQEGGQAPNYQVTAADGRIIRVNTESGTVIACQEKRCAIVLERGQDLEDEVPLPALSRPAEARPETRPAPALPAPEKAAGNEAGAREER